MYRSVFCLSQFNNKKEIMKLAIAFICIIVAYISAEKDFKELSLILAMICGMLIHVHCTKKEPSAIEVYRGNTVLEITYRDSIPIDSVVIFKDLKCRQ